MKLHEQEVMERVLKDIKDLAIRKNYGYGRNIQLRGMKGVVIRQAGKVQRLENLVLGDKVEEVEDTLVDVAGYAIRALTPVGCDDLSPSTTIHEARNSLETYSNFLQRDLVDTTLNVREEETEPDHRTKETHHV